MLSRLSLNSLWLLLSRLGTQAGMAVFTILLARGLGTAIFGEYAFMASVIVIGNVLTTFGTDMHLIREIAADDDITDLLPALYLQLSLSCAFIALLIIVSPFLPLQERDTSQALRIYSLSMLPLAFFTVFTTALRGRQRMLAYASLNLASMTLQVAAAVWLISHSGGLVALAVLLVGVQVCAAILAGLLCVKEIREMAHRKDTNLHSVFPLLKASAPIALLGILGIVYLRLSILVLPVLAGAAATGSFSAAARLVEAAKIGHIAGFTALYPSMAQTRAGSDPAWLRAFRLPGLVLVLGALLASLVIWLLSESLIPLLFGQQYTASIPVAQILAWILVPYAINSLLTLALLTQHEEAVIGRALVVSILVLFLLTLLWVPMIGTTGAAWAALCSEATQALALLIFASRSSMRMMDALLRPGHVS